MATIMVYRCDSAFANTATLPESIFDKLEKYDLALAIRPIPPFVELNMEEYNSIKDILTMERIKIKVSDYYGNPSYYSVMPQALFDLLEAATLNGEEWVLADKAQVDKMITEHQIKQKQWENSNS